MTTKDRDELWGPAKKKVCGICGQTYYGKKCINECVAKPQARGEAVLSDNLHYRHPGDFRDPSLPN